MINNFKQPPRGRRQTMDGILNAPSRPQLTGRPLSPRQLNGDTLRTTPRAIGNFRRTEGYHIANSPLASPRKGRIMQQKQAAAESPHASTLSLVLPEVRDSKESTGKKGRRGKLRGHRSGQQKSKVRKYAFRGGLAALACLVLIGGFLFTKGYLKLHKVFKGGGSAAALHANVNPSLLKGEGDGRINVLLMGRGGEGHDGADLTDTILLGSFDPVGKRVAMASIPRDMWVTTSGGSSKINAIFANAKSKSLNRGSDKKKAEADAVKVVQEEVKEIFGVPVHYYAMVDFAAFQQAVDAVGGVDVNITSETAVTERLWNPATRKNYYLNVTPGKQHFDGLKALFYTRSRHTSPRGDFDRAERQRVFLQALAQKVLSAKTFTNPVKVSQLLDAFGDHVATDMSINDAMRLQQLARGVGGNFESIDLASPDKSLVRTDMIAGQSVVVPVAGIGDYSEIHMLMRTKLRDGYLAKENAVVSVLNGTQIAGLAGQKAEELRSYGYNIGTVADAPTQNYQDTVIVDLTKGKKRYTKNYLQKRFDVKATAKLPDQTITTEGAHFVIILGQP